MAGREERARLVDRERDAGGEAELRHLVDEDAVVRQRAAHGLQEPHLRLEARQAIGEPGLWPASSPRARGALAIVRRQRFEQRAGIVLRIADE